MGKREKKVVKSKTLLLAKKNFHLACNDMDIMISDYSDKLLEISAMCLSSITLLKDEFGIYAENICEVSELIAKCIKLHTRVKSDYDDISKDISKDPIQVVDIKNTAIGKLYLELHTSLVSDVLGEMSVHLLNIESLVPESQ